MSVLERVWQTLAVAAALTGAGLILMVVAAPHTIQQYYVGHPNSNGGTNTPGYCVMASVNWETDTVVFCTDDIDKAIGESQKLNQTLKGAR